MTIKVADLLEALDLGENDDWEFKNGRGGLGKSWLESISAFANTLGGVVVFGVVSFDDDTAHDPVGIEDTQKFIKHIWDALNDKGRINYAPCGSGDVWVVRVKGVDLVCVRVPQADRRRRPVFVGKEPFKGTYKRRESGDYLCDEEEVRQMLRDAKDDAQDSLVLAGTTMADIDADTFAAYRNAFASNRPGHPHVRLADEALLKKLGGRKDDGLTLAGIVMFGTEDVLRDAFADLFLDYFERTDRKSRYDDRFTSNDGDWVPNLFNFFHKAYPALVKGLKVPFALGPDAMRKGETPFHHALREALTNALVHADYRARGTIRIAKLTDAFVFSNPGRSLTSIRRIREARHAGEELSDIRNPNLVRMFQLLGFAERQGYGYPTIFRAWDEGKRHSPVIEEDLEQNMCRVTLPLLGQISPENEREMRRVVGPRYALLSGLDKDILLHAYQFGQTSNQALQFARKEHPHEIGMRLRYLAEQGWLKPLGSGRGRSYRFPESPKLRDLFGGLAGGEKQDTPPVNGHSPPPKEPSPSPTDDGNRVNLVSEAIRNRDRVSRGEMEAAIMELCRGRFVTVKELAMLTGRKSTDKFRETYITGMANDGRLARLHPSVPGHVRQAYKTTGT